MTATDVLRARWSVAVPTVEQAMTSKPGHSISMLIVRSIHLETSSYLDMRLLPGCGSSWPSRMCC